MVPALLQGQARLGAVQGLDLGLLIDTEDHGVGGRIDIQADDVADHSGELRIVGKLEGADPVRVAPCKRVEVCRLRWRPRQSLASSCEPTLAWRPVTAVAKRRQGGCRPEGTERKNSPEIDRDRSSRPCLSKGKAEPQAAATRAVRGAPGVRTASMQPKEATRTREIHPVQAHACRTCQAEEVRRV